MSKAYPITQLAEVPDPPPAYADLSSQNSSSPSAPVEPAFIGFTTVDMEPLDTLEEVLGDHEVFKFHAMGKLNCNPSTALIVQIRGRHDEVLMSTMMTTVAISRSESMTEQKTVNCTDPTGKVLLTFTESGSTIVVNGDRPFGVIEREGIILCSLNLKAKNSDGEVLFRAIRIGGDVEFVSESGHVIASAKNLEHTYGNDFSLELSPALDCSTKAMLLAASYYLNILYFARTNCGCFGMVSMCKLFCLVPLIAFVLVSLVVASNAISYANFKAGSED